MGDITKYNQRRGFATLLLTIFLMHLCSISLFTHYHHFNDGIIAHSHIYVGTPDNPDHGHTKEQVQLIATLSGITAMSATIHQIDFNPTYFLCSIILFGAAHAISRTTTLHQLRAPPATM